MKFLISLASAVIIMITFFVLKTLTTFNFITEWKGYDYFEYACFITFCVPGFIIIKDFLDRKRKAKEKASYIEKLSNVQIEQSKNEVFFSGNLITGSRILAKSVSEALESDRCSIWLYNQERDSIVLQQLYIRAEDSFYQDLSLHRKDFEDYFIALEDDPVIVADDAETHPATICFLESYLRPLGVKSMLDVPIWHRGEIIGVICIESLTSRQWKEEEVKFAQILSSLYSFGYSVKESNTLSEQMVEQENFLEASAIISIADEKGKITYVNKKFSEVSGYSLEEVAGKDHNIVNSGEHTREFWANMYKTTVQDKKIWNDVCTNRAKDGSLYYVDTYIKSRFDESGKLLGFMSIRQDVTSIVNSAKELEKKNTYLEHAAKILRHDMHSGINTYMPRGLSSLERRLTDEQAKELKIDAPLRMIKEGLRHSQKVYKGVYEFTNLVKKDVVLNREDHDLKVILEDYLTSTAYRPQVLISDLGCYSVNEALFCTSIDNLIRNGLKYNDSLSKFVKIYRIDNFLYVEDNGRGLTQEDFEKLSKPYTRKEGQKESGTGLGLNICIAILEEHGFKISCSKLENGGTQMKIRLNV